MAGALRSMREEIDLIHEEIQEIRVALRHLPADRWKGLDLTAGESVILGALATGMPHTTAKLLSKLNVAFPFDGRVPRTIKIHVCRIRAKLRELAPPVTIITKPIAGYWIDPENCALLAALRH